MSGIFNGDSIYKSGGGGGGFKDGGQLVDGDFIKVENNTVSSYDNVSRNEVNFYFDVKDGEILNSIVELTTAVNATINVYVVKNGLFYLLGNVGGNTVNAGDDYKVNITGDSYAVEQVTNSNSNPDYINFGGQFGICRLVYTSSLIWTGKDLMFDTRANCIAATSHLTGWRIPSNSEWTQLFNTYGAAALCSASGWNGTQGNNSSHFDAQPKGRGGSYIGDYFCSFQQEFFGYYSIQLNPTDTGLAASTSNAKMSLRLCRNR